MQQALNHLIERAEVWLIFICILQYRLYSILSFQQLSPSGPSGPLPILVLTSATKMHLLCRQLHWEQSNVPPCAPTEMFTWLLNEACKAGDFQNSHKMFERDVSKQSNNPFQNQTQLLCAALSWEPNLSFRCLFFIIICQHPPRHKPRLHHFPFLFAAINIHLHYLWIQLVSCLLTLKEAE